VYDLFMPDFSGRWLTTYGSMELTQARVRVHGAYRYLGQDCLLEGRVEGRRLVFAYREPNARGEGWFELKRGGKALTGGYRPEGAEHWGPWDGVRVGFDGVWQTPFGLLRLVEDGDRVRGYYEAGGAATLEGTRAGADLQFSYTEPRAWGRGRFSLADDGYHFSGEWQPDGTEQWSPWPGQRVLPRPNVTWLVIFEAPWQRSFQEPEYSFGAMLREFFARLPHVRVRQRFFGDGAALRRCCRELYYLSEPTIVLVATHGLAEGLTVGGETVPLPDLLEAVEDAGDLRLLHFSSCLVLHDSARVEGLQAFCDRTGTPVSGYRTAVNWGASAIVEFAYLELLLNHGLSPAEAAAELARQLPFAGDRGVRGGAFPPAGFRIVTPREAG
jgi:hypothetical protein